ncbi:sulfotransferase, partial [Gammaproteobacteria bacterium]|nr:sulfotransferase [Gammaproteobacteria bacterium]
KNPSFTPFLSALHETFADGSFIACTRAPVEVIPSQLSSLVPVMALLGNGKLNALIQDKILELLYRYYEIIQQQAARNNLAVISMEMLQSDLKKTMHGLYRYIDQEMSAVYLQRLDELVAKAKSYQSRHRYHVEEFSLTEEVIQLKFSKVWPVKPTLLMVDE